MTDLDDDTSLSYPLFLFQAEIEKQQVDESMEEFKQKQRERAEGLHEGRKMLRTGPDG
jgi:hypothetical protein